MINRVVKALLLAATCAVTACQSNPPPRFSCSVPTSNDVSEAFSHAKSDLRHEECQFQFDDYVDTLLVTAASDPKERNKKRFSEFFAWSRDQDILSQAQAQDYYRRYFTPDFVALNDKYNNCSTTCRNKNKVLVRMRDELKDKDRGLLRAAGDRGSYSQADKEYNELLTLIEATCLACRRAR